MSIEISKIVTIREDRDYYYSVEDVNIDVGCDGITIAYHEDPHNKRLHYMIFSDDVAKNIAESILKLIEERNNERNHS